MRARAIVGTFVVVAACGAGGCGSRAAAPAPRPAVAQIAAGPAPAPRHRGLAPLAPVARRPGPPVATPVPVLMYHVIATAPPGVAYPELWVTAELFRAQLRALRSRGYQAITLQRAWDAWHGRDRLPARPVVLSFDDGYLSQYTHAAKELRALGWPGVLNLKVGNIGPGGLTAYEVRSMIGAGWELDAHSLTHPDLTTLDAARLRTEVAGSRRALQRRFGVPVRFFCYPSGRFNAAAEGAVRRAGFTGATTTQRGLAAPGIDPDAEPRVRVNAGESPAALLRSIATATVSPSAPSGE